MADIVLESKNHHSKLYFTDGNLVICCRDPDFTPTYFKVHQSVLSTHAHVIKDIIGLPSTGKSADFYDGVPFIEFSETSEDVESFLNFYYYPFSPGNLLRDDNLVIASQNLWCSRTSGEVRGGRLENGHLAKD
ncbi:hypothetical protein CPB83DRAFT_854654 [Crepidotus variabilis]|uniref:BTB domain-containing protein n=1 Tax=Crepidotus variabilis TaxID=179855 RepID=A0A9P6EFM1_9AGAR|nr:hypothetical protein CPB83DRAFT_854654 [Crepidotus variabilis]